MKQLIKHIALLLLSLFSLKTWALPPIVAMGDLHGDYLETLKLLTLILLFKILG